MSEDKIESRRTFLSSLAKAAGAAAFAAPFMAENLCFSKETLDQIEGDLDKIQVKDEQQASDNPQTGKDCDCYECCGTNYQHKKCDCSNACGSPNGPIRKPCECYVTCGSSNYSY